MRAAQAPFGLSSSARDALAWERRLRCSCCEGCGNMITGQCLNCGAGPEPAIEPAPTGRRWLCSDCAHEVMNSSLERPPPPPASLNLPGILVPLLSQPCVRLFALLALLALLPCRLATPAPPFFSFFFAFVPSADAVAADSQPMQQGRQQRRWQHCWCSRQPRHSPSTRCMPSSGCCMPPCSSLPAARTAPSPP